LHFPTAHLVPLAAILLIAVGWDVRVRRIPNLICGAAALAGLGARFWDDGGLSALAGVGAGVVTIAALFPFWRRGGIGGGDVKFAGAVAIAVGLPSLPAYWLATALAGGATAIVCLLLSQRAVRREVRANLTVAALHQIIPEVRPGFPGRVSVPYGVAIALGAVFVWWRGLG
jgi:prepilin peptidase CpaA